MAKNIRRMLAMVLVLCMVFSALPMQALAAEGETIQQDGLNITITPSEGGGESGGSSSTVVVSGTSESTKADVIMEGTKEVTTETTKDSSGNTTTNTKTEVSLEGTVTEDNIVKDATWQETTQESSTTNSNGEEIKSSIVIDGESTKKWDTPNEEDDDPNKSKSEPDVTVSLIPGQTTTGEAIVQGTLKSETTTKEDGTVVTDTTYEVDRTVTATTSKLEVTVNDSNTGLEKDRETILKGLDPVYDEDDNVVYRPDGKIHDGYGKDGLFDRNYLSSNSSFNNPGSWNNIPEEADFRLVGTGEHSIYYNARVTVTYEKDANGNTVFDAEGNPVVKSITKKDGTPITIDGVPTTELVDEVSLKPVYDDYNGGRPKTFMLMDKNGNKVYAYCCDMETGANEGAWYSVSNLEDSDYYASEESEEHIRSIVMNGYWGTSDVKNEEDNSYNRGSLESIKQNLRDAIASKPSLNTEVKVATVDAAGNPVLDADGNPVMESKTMLELIDSLTEGEALMATQSAIWSYSNGSLAVKNGKDGVIVVDPDGYKWNHDPNNGSKIWTDANGNPFDLGTLDDYGSARVDFLYNWLINLETTEDSTVIINDKNFVEDISFTVQDKVAEGKVDEDGTEHDLYNTELNFKLAFTPGENDELFIELTNGDKENPQIICDANNNPIKKKLVNAENYGKATEDEKKTMLCANSEGVYTLTGLQLHENTDFTFDLRLEGTQYLEQGVYLYQPVGGRSVSQTFVGIAEGEQNVDVSAGMTISFDVDETNKTVVKRVWHYDNDPSNDPPATPPSPPEYPVNPVDFEEAAPQVFRLANQNVEEIPEEPVPLAAPVITGDNSGMWIAVILLSVFAMAAVNLFDKKRQHETF